MISLQQTLSMVKKLKAFPLRSGTRQEWPFSPLLFNIVLEVLATATREKEKEPRLEKKKQNSHCLQMTLPYIENPKETIRKLLELISELSKVTGYKVNTQKSLAFQYIKNYEKSEREIKESISFTIVTKRIKQLGINLPKSSYGFSSGHVWM